MDLKLRPGKPKDAESVHASVLRLSAPSLGEVGAPKLFRRAWGERGYEGDPIDAVKTKEALLTIGGGGRVVTAIACHHDDTVSSPPSVRRCSHGVIH